MKPTVIIRADSSSTIGTGHIMRDLVLAKRVFADHRVIFAVRDLPGHIYHKVEAAGYPLVWLESDDIEALIALTKRKKARTVVIDHYGIDVIRERQLKEATGATLWVLDDTYESHHCDVLLNHNLYADPARYRGLVPEFCELRCGPDYMLLREEFYEAKKLSRPDNRPPLRVLVAMGGADTANLNIPVAEILGEFPRVEVYILTTSANPRLKELEAYAKEASHVTLHVDSKEVAKLMRSVHFAIATPSVTLNELFFLETPFIAVQTVENQKEMASFLRRRRLPLLEVYYEGKLRAHMAMRIASISTRIEAFPQLDAIWHDRVLSWRNDPSVRRWMFTDRPITPEEHRTFVRNLPRDPTRFYGLVFQGEEPLGVVDLTAIDPEKGSAHIGLYARPGVRGAGALLMGALLHEAFIKRRLKKVRAEVFVDNERAIALYRRFGFREKGAKVHEKGELSIMELAL